VRNERPSNGAGDCRFEILCQPATATKPCESTFDEANMTEPPLIASPNWTMEEDARLRRLAEEGRSTAVIAERLKRGEDAVRSRATRLRISLRRIAKKR